MFDYISGKVIIGVIIIAYIIAMWFPVGFNKQLVNLTQEFIVDARKHNVHVELEDLGGINYVNIPDWIDASGICFPWLGYKYYIFIDNDVKYYSRLEKKVLVYHELGHCEFNILFHSDEELNIMNSQVLSIDKLQINWYQLISKFFRRQRDD